MGPKPEILHSGQFWQEKRRLRNLREARRRRIEEDSEGQAYAVEYPVPEQGEVHTWCPPAAARRPTRPVTTTNSILATRAREDDLLLARFAAAREKEKQSDKMHAARPSASRAKGVDLKAKQSVEGSKLYLFSPPSTNAASGSTRRT
ncbi:hypothetical protein C8R47DRAFT_1230713 [Mycena vitilis]|nr:hypothetical protein C8R47DRAFT_1230713 [Mycena vitilis]